MATPSPNRRRRVLLRALALRCPVCGRGPLFASWLRMHDRCSVCNLKFDRAPGYYLGSIYVNYGLTAFLVTAGFLALFVTGTFSPETQLALCTAFCVLFPLWFFRYARALWLGFDLYWDRRQLTDEEQRYSEQA